MLALILFKGTFRISFSFDRGGGGGGWGTLGILLDVGVPPGSPNSHPISDQ